MDKLCINCKYYSVNLLELKIVCKRDFDSSKVDLVTGNRNNVAGPYYNCYIERSKNGPCGIKGKFWEKNEV